MKFLKRNWKEVRPRTPNSHASWWSKVKTLAIASMMWLFASCDNIPNDKIIWDQETLTEIFNIMHNHSGWWSGEPTIVNYNVFVSKDGEKYVWRIEQKDWFFKNVTEIESDNIDALFDEIWRKLDSEKISESTRDKQNAKVAFAKQVYKDNVLNKKNPPKWAKSSKWEITIEYE